ncbi:LysR family transcriptional regulator [Zwartia sp.]|uniref:LysR family transcriptional regulator n=1 Tax=Zwartia sp. TaxID=2978004 RepID=UPI002726FA37|nr:LysR family transcriptional regulator [Zwartia sp.]MDO9023656.1 LysR family transcriptional regulator [Zwartia sp.]
MANLKQLEYFRAVMLYGSINRASTHLCVSQPVVSRVIAQLERTIELKLFERKASHLVPTQNAFVLNRYCDDIFEKTHRLDAVIKSLQVQHTDRLKFCAAPALCSSFLPKVIASYNKDVIISFESSMLKDLGSDIESGTFEFGFSVWPIISNRLECNALSKSDFVFLCHKTNPLRKNRTIQFEDLADQDFIFTNRNMPIGEYIDRKFQEKNITCKRYLEVDRGDVICSIINAGRGVSIVNRHAFDPEQWRNVCSVELEHPINTHIYLLTPKAISLSPTALGFIAHLQTHLTEQS